MTESGKSAHNPAPVRVTEGIAPLLRDLVHERTGIFFDNERIDLLLSKLTPCAERRGCGSFLEYYYLLKDNSGDCWREAWEALSVQETYFWREMSQIEALTHVVIPNWFKSHRETFRVWSAACATGEEPYTIAMAIVEAGLGSHPIEIMASDVSSAALEKARAAVYREKSFRTLPFHLRQKYFKAEGNGWKLSPDIASKVSWHQANLCATGDIALLARAQAVFCRNVFIYFSRHAIRQTVATMGARMARGSCLFVGASESLLRLTTDFEMTEMGGAIVYVRI